MRFSVPAPPVTYPSPNEWPETIHDITAITNAAQAQITSTDHGFTAEDVNVTSIDFLQVRGMTQINGLMGVIQSIIDDNNFTVNINTTQFYTYTSGGVYNIVTGTPPLTSEGYQTFNTPFKNIL